MTTIIFRAAKMWSWDSYPSLCACQPVFATLYPGFLLPCQPLCQARLASGLGSLCCWDWTHSLQKSSSRDRCPWPHLGALTSSSCFLVSHSRAPLLPAQVVMGIVFSIPGFLLPSSYGIYSNSPHSFPWQLHPDPIPCWLPGSGQCQ